MVLKVTQEQPEQEVLPEPKVFKETQEDKEHKVTKD
jgi:hypothetical protein